MHTQKTSIAAKSSADAALKPKNKAAASFPIVGIGASAGGLEAFEQFFRHMPVDSGMAFVLVQHLDPDHASLLTEILQRATRMQVVEAKDQLTVEPNCVYIIPPNRDMEIFHGKLQLSVPTLPRGQRLPIDAFLRSLANDQQDKAVGIVLSGTGSDGTLGLRAIQGGGGITLAQEPGLAKYDGMPNSAIHAGYASIILPVERMPEALLADVRNFMVHTEPSATKALSGMDHILAQLCNSTGHDFSLYKKTTIIRRIERRMLLHAIDDIEAYARYLKENPAEVRVLFKELLINVTSFFRDKEAFVEMEKHILPGLLKDKPEGYVFRAWVAGCATGEEAYSIAMLLRECMDKMNRQFKVLIYSTDLSKEVIDIARSGFYPTNIFQDVPSERLNRFFIKDDAGFKVKKKIREMIVFAVQNIIQDPPFTKLDLLSCRNLMIYLKPELQDRLVSMFHYSLKPDGVLFISPSESIGHHVDLFTPLNRKWKYYRAIHNSTSTRALMRGPLNWPVQSGIKASEEVMTSTNEINYAELTQRLLAQAFAPASVITDIKGNILYVHGETGKYLRPAPGKASLNVIEMAREGLNQALRIAIQAAAANEAFMLNQDVLVLTEGESMTVRLSVRPIPDSEAGRRLLLVSFQDVVAPVEKTGRRRPAKSAGLERIEELERDLTYVKENHQTSIKEQQAFNEELQSANEELQSINEELQSSNEELEISREELQSVNEELITVNSELQIKIEQLADMQNDMKNLLDNVNIGIIFLDKHLVIRRFTREATRVYRLVATDVGRPLSDIKPIAAGDELLIAAQTVLESLMPYEREMCIDHDAWVLARIQLYRTVDKIIDGVVITFTDITARVQSYFVAQQARVLAESIVNTIREPLIVLDSALNVVSASQSFYHDFNITQKEVLGHLIYEIGGGQWDTPALRERLQNVLSSEHSLVDYGVEHDFPDGQRKILLNARRVVGKVGEPPLILLSMEVNP